TRKGWLGLGIVLGVGALFRQTLLLFAPVLLWWVIWQRNGAERGGTSLNTLQVARLPSWLSGPAASLIIMAACVLPITAFNYTTFHDFLLLNSNGGYWFYASNHPSQGTNFDPNAVPPLPPALVDLAEPARDRALYREALRFVLAD